ncbi:ENDONUCLEASE V [Salix viminalis]|uniref:ENDONUCLEASE V n=1 Tax=Salix viminalis TaxID=40686 RepID=A0A9Q0NPW0_SALVM|nr:ENDONUCLEASE V [Salix viminalis]
MDDYGFRHGRDRGESSSIETQNQWREIQDLLKERLITQDDFPWKLPIPSSSGNVAVEEEGGGGGGGALLKYVGGVDSSTKISLSSPISMSLIFLPFLAFREAPILLQLLQKMKNSGNPFYPQLLLVDGNGLLHPRGFGLACHLGVLANIPAIGIGKNLHHVDGLTESGVRQLLQAKDNSGEDFITLTGSSGCVLGAAMRSTKGSCKPIYVSVGHRVSLNTAIKIVKMICKYRVPEPIRQADIRSRDHLQKNSGGNDGTLQ